MNMRKWFEAHDGQTVFTAQMDRTRPDAPLWYPGPREVDASKATYVTMNGSRRDYKGMKVVEATETTLVVRDDWHEIAYWEPGATFDRTWQGS